MSLFIYKVCFYKVNERDRVVGRVDLNVISPDKKAAVDSALSGLPVSFGKPTLYSVEPVGPVSELVAEAPVVQEVVQPETPVTAPAAVAPVAEVDVDFFAKQPIRWINFFVDEELGSKPYIKVGYGHGPHLDRHIKVYEGPLNGSLRADDLAEPLAVFLAACAHSLDRLLKPE